MFTPLEQLSEEKPLGTFVGESDSLMWINILDDNTIAIDGILTLNDLKKIVEFVESRQ